MTRILLVDDHPVVRAGYQRLLEHDGTATVVAQAGSVDEAWGQYRRHLPDLMITDIAMPGSGGLELLRRVRAIRPDARVVVFSMHDSDMLVRRALELGASAFVSKSSSPDHLVEAVLSVMSGRRYLSPGLTPCLTERGGESDALRALTHREIEILRLIAAGESPASCARVLHLSPKTVSNRQSIIKGKLGIRTTMGLVRLALRCGLPIGDGS
jgi:DNA-binding NarL/FixJ family response regulator